MAVDTNRGSSGVVLPKAVASEIWSNMQEASAVQQLATRVSLPGSGITIPVITGDPAADWVEETDEKPVDDPAFSSKNLTPYTLAVIVPFSNQFKRDLPALYAECVKRLPGALAKKFDSTVFGTAGAPGQDFAQIGAATDVKLTPHATDAKKGTYAGLVEAYSNIASAGGVLDGWALSAAAKGLLLGQVDTTGRPILLESIVSGTSIPTLLGEPVAYSQGVVASTTIGFAGDWASAVWGTVEGVNIDISEGTITNGTVTVKDSADGDMVIPNVINLWQRNMFAVRAEIEIGFQIRDINRFNRLTSAIRT